jgi:hypothetical protein
MARALMQSYADCAEGVRTHRVQALRYRPKIRGMRVKTRKDSVHANPPSRELE